MDVDPMTQQVALKGVFKILGGLVSQYGPRLFRKGAAEKVKERLLTAQATVDEQKILTAGEYDIKELKARREHQLRSLKRELKTQKLQEGEAAQLPPSDDDIPVLLDDIWVIDTTTSDEQRSPIEYVEHKRLKNVRQVAQEAIKALPEHKDVSDEPVDPDWFARFFDNVKDVSQQDMQKLWGKLLSGEVAQPGTYSLRTLDVLRNLTSKDTQLFQRYCGACSNIGEIIIPSQPEFRQATQIHPFEARHLVECGLLHAEKEFLHGGFATPTELRIPFRDKIVHIYSTPPVGNFLGHVYLLTEAGVQLARLRFPTADEVYIRALREAAERNGLKTEILDATPPIAPTAADEAAEGDVAAKKG